MDCKDNSGKPIILIADDNDVMRRLLRNWIAVRFPAFHILEAEDGKEAVRLSLAWEPEIILTEIWMPKMNGFDAARCIKAVIPDIKIVVITSDENRHCKDRASSAGAEAYILKREAGEKLIPALREMLNDYAFAGAE